MFRWLPDIFTTTLRTSRLDPSRSVGTCMAVGTSGRPKVWVWIQLGVETLLGQSGRPPGGSRGGVRRRNAEHVDVFVAHRFRLGEIDWHGPIGGEGRRGRCEQPRFTMSGGFVSARLARTSTPGHNARPCRGGEPRAVPAATRVASCGDVDDVVGAQPLGAPSRTGLRCREDQRGARAWRRRRNPRPGRHDDRLAGDDAA